MSQTVTLELPDTIYQPAQRMAKAIQSSLTEVLVNALKASLPALEGVSSTLATELVNLEQLDDDALWQVMLSRVSANQQKKLNHLLQKNKRGSLTESERVELAALQNEADRIMLRKARAAVLLRFRGHRLPTLAELRKLSRTRGK
jgi:hypothetical protein